MTGLETKKKTDDQSRALMVNRLLLAILLTSHLLGCVQESIEAVLPVVALFFAKLF